jgi:hypothetical protein
MKLSTNLLMAKLARLRFRAFAQLINKKYEVATIHKIFSDMIERIYTTLTTPGAELYLIVAVPPRHGKTHTFVELAGPWLMGLLPGLEFIFATHTGKFAEKTGSKIRDIINSKQYQSIMPDAMLRKDEKSKSSMRLENSSSFLGVGVGSKLVTGSGGNILVADDLFGSRADAESKTSRDNAWEYFRDTLGSRLQPYQARDPQTNETVKYGKVKIVIMQRWHEDDVVGRLMEEQAKNELENPDGDFEKWEIINFEAVASEDQYYEGELFRKAGEALWPEVFPVKALEVIKSKSLYAWASQYQQDPILSELQVFKKEYFKYYDPMDEDFKRKKLDYYTLIDPAISQDDDADNTVVLTIAKERDSFDIYRIREDAGHFTPKETVDLIFKHHEEFKSRVTIEAIQYQKALVFAVEEEQSKRGVYFKVYETKRGNKEERIGVGLLSLYERGVIYHRKGMYDTAYEMELLKFPRGKRDDRADCMSFCLDALKKTETARQTNTIRQRVRSYMKR